MRRDESSDSDNDSDADDAFASLLRSDDDLFEESEAQVAKRKKAQEFVENYSQRAWGLRNRLLQSTLHHGGVVQHTFELVDQSKTVVFMEKQGQQAKVWDCALVLAKFLTHERFFPQGYFDGKRVIELGCGIGVPGISAAALGAAQVLLTDMDVAVPWIQVNIERNATLFHGSVRAQVLLWGPPDPTLQVFDVILCSDLIYGEPNISEALVETISSLCHDHTRIVSCHEARFAGDQGQSFFDALRRQGFQIQPVPFDQLDQAYRAAKVHVNLITKDKKPTDSIEQ